MSRSIMCIDTSEILDGKVEEVEVAIASMASFVEANEPDVIMYDVFLDASRTLMTVVQIHPDPASMEAHLDAAQPVFAPFVGLVRLATIDLYGEPSARLLEQLRQKAAMLGNARIIVHPVRGRHRAVRLISERATGSPHSTSAIPKATSHSDQAM